MLWPDFGCQMTLFLKLWIKVVLCSKVNFLKKLGTFLKTHLSQGMLQKNKSMLVEQFSGCSNELKLIKKPLTGCKLIQM